MATRIKRQTNTLHDTTTGTVNIVHGSSPKPQNIGFFDRSFTNTGSSSRRKRRRRLHARAQQAAQAKAAAAAQAAAQAEIQAQHEAQLRAQAAEHARIEADNRARAEREQTYRHTINTLAQAQHSLQADLAQRYSQATSSQAAMLHGEIVSNIEPLTGNPTGQQLADLILQEKTRINDLLAQKSTELEKRSLETLSQAQALSATTTERYRDYLESRSNGDPALAQQAHQTWSHAADNVQESKLLADAIVLLEQESAALSARHALITQPAAPHSHTPAAADLTAERLWSAVGASGSPSTLPAPSDTLEKAQQAAKKIFLKTATDVLKRHPAVALALYSPTLADAERPSSTIATPVSQLNLPKHLDLAYVASVNGSIDVPHRLAMVDDGQKPVAKWVATDGVEVGTKVRVRHFTYNTQNNTYEFIRDGDTTPALVWTPIEKPTDSSTFFPGQKPLLPADPGTDVSPQEGWIEDLPSFANDDPDDYILVFPPGSGLPDTYFLFKDPRDIPGTATGYGRPVTETWLGQSTRGHGVPIPAHIADQLRERKFSSFRKFREALWAAIAKDPNLQEQFIEQNKQEMSQGRAPYARAEDQAGDNKKFEIHHPHEIAQGGAVYDMDNMLIMTPRRHIEHHQRTADEN